MSQSPTPQPFDYNELSVNFQPLSSFVIDIAKMEGFTEGTAVNIPAGMVAIRNGIGPAEAEILQDKKNLACFADLFSILRRAFFERLKPDDDGQRQITLDDVESAFVLSKFDIDRDQMLRVQLRGKPLNEFQSRLIDIANNTIRRIPDSCSRQDEVIDAWKSAIGFAAWKNDYINRWIISACVTKAIGATAMAGASIISGAWCVTCLIAGLLLLIGGELFEKFTVLGPKR